VREGVLAHRWLRCLRHHVRAHRGRSRLRLQREPEMTAVAVERSVAIATPTTLMIALRSITATTARPQGAWCLRHGWRLGAGEPCCPVLRGGIRRFPTNCFNCASIEVRGPAWKQTRALTATHKSLISFEKSGAGEGFEPRPQPGNNKFWHFLASWCGRRDLNPHSLSRSRFSYHLGFRRRHTGVRRLDYPLAVAFRP
jgi:hypothetical protein